MLATVLILTRLILIEKLELIINLTNNRVVGAMVDPGTKEREDAKSDKQ